MMEKRGVVEGFTVKLIIVAVAVVLIGGAVIVYGSDFIGVLNNIFPDFGSGDDGGVNVNEGDFLVRYNVLDESIDYYSNGNWINFGENRVVNVSGSNYGSEDFKNVLRNYYRGERDYPREIDLIYTAKDDFYPKDVSVPFLDAVIGRLVYSSNEDFGSYYVLVLLRSQNELDKSEWGDFVVTYYNELYFRKHGEVGYHKVKTGDYTENHQRVVDGADAWRDSIFDKSLEIEGSEYEVQNNGAYIAVEVKLG